MSNDNKSDFEVRTASGTKLRPKRKLEGDTSIEARIRAARQRRQQELGVTTESNAPVPAPTRPRRRTYQPRTRTRPRAANTAQPTPRISRPSAPETAEFHARPETSARTRPVHRVLPKPLEVVDEYSDSQKALALRDLQELTERLGGQPSFEVRLHWFRFLCGVERSSVAQTEITKQISAFSDGDPDKAHAQFLLGRILALDKQYRSAVQRFEAALDLASGHGGARAELEKANRMLETLNLSSGDADATDEAASWFTKMFKR